MLSQVPTAVHNASPASAWSSAAEWSPALARSSLAARSRSTAEASISLAGNNRRYPVGVLSMTPGATRDRARHTNTCNALAGCSGGSSGHSAATNRAVLQPVRSSSASNANRPPSRAPTSSTPR
ncbi:hypothetical protein GCM10029964_079940 [Kibdelosporangium lantanae]